MMQKAMTLVFFLGAAQAILLVLGINIKMPLATALKKVTSLLLLAIAIISFYYIVILRSYGDIYPYIDSLGSAAWMAICPLYYVLCRQLVHPQRKLTPKDALLFPMSLLFLMEGLASNLRSEWLIFNAIGDPTLFLDLWMIYFFGTGLFFIYKSILLVRNNTYPLGIKELKVFSYVFMTLLIAFALLFLIVRTEYSYTFEYILIGLMQVFVLILVYRLFKFATFHSLIGVKQYANTQASSEQLQSEAEKLEELMAEKKPFLDKKLTLAQLAKEAETHPTALSQLFNLHYKSNFYSFVSKYRLDYLESLIDLPENAKFTITALAEISGFNSKATFYKAFKERHGTTPTAYLKGRKSKV